MAELLEMPENRIKQRLYQMSKDGEVRVVSRGRYELHNLHNFHNQEDANATEVFEVRNLHNGSGVIRSEQEVSELAREHFGLNVKDGKPS